MENKGRHLISSLPLIQFDKESGKSWGVEYIGFQKFRTLNLFLKKIKKTNSIIR